MQNNAIRFCIKFLKRFVRFCEIHDLVQIQNSKLLITPLLSVIVQTDWNEGVSKESISQIILLLKHLMAVSDKCERWQIQILIDMIQAPLWKRTIIRGVILRSEGLDLEEVFKLFAEDGLICVHRYRVLFENKLIPWCLNYLTWIYQCYINNSKRLEDAISLSNVQLLLDTYIILLNDNKDMRGIFSVVNSLSYSEVINIILRLNGKFKRTDISTDIAYILIAKLPINDLAGNENIFTRIVNFLCEMIAKNPQLDINKLKTKFNAVCKFALTSDPIYIIAREINKQFVNDQRLTTFVTELYVRGLTTDISILDHAKWVLKNPKIVRTVGEKISQIFIELSNIFVDHEIQREFILNAFITNPCTETLQLLNNTVSETNIQQSTAFDASNCYWHTLKNIENTWCIECGVSKRIKISQPVAKDLTELLNPKNINLAPHLCDDLIVILSSTRVKQLNWSVNWDEMSRRCYEYMEQYKNLDSILSKKLQYLDVDYMYFHKI